MSFENLGYDQLAFKAAHNSYQRDESVAEQLVWHDDRRYDCGCRGVELDFTRHSDGSGGKNATYFQVTHEQGGEGTNLSVYLAELLAWHSDNAGHDPVLVGLDIKSKEGKKELFPDEMDTYLRTWFDASLIYTPGALIARKPPGAASDAPKIAEPLDLVETVQNNGWPYLSELKGRFLFCLSGYEPWKSYYAQTAPNDRLCFADFDVSDEAKWTDVDSGTRVVANLHLYSDHYGKWKKLVPDLRAQRFLVRGWVLNGSDLWKKAQKVGVNVLATDKVSDHEWAVVGNAPLVPSAPQAG